MKDIIEFLRSHKYYLVVAILVFTSIVLSITYSNYFVESGNHKAAEMYIGELSYTININGNNTNFVSIPNGTSDITLLISSKNEINTKYKLGYIIDNNNSNYSIYYYNDTSYSTPSGSITSNGNKSIRLRITNNSSTALKFTFKAFGGYDHNDLNGIVLSGGYMQITEVVPDACVFTGNLVDGATYSYGQYTYIYKMYNYYNVDEDSYQLESLSDDGWSVILTDKDSTAPVTSEICSSINDKPIVSTSAMFANSNTQYLYFISDIPDGSILDNMFENCTIDTVYIPSTVINSDFTPDVTKSPDSMKITVII